MTDLTIRDLDERIIEALTRRAKANNRSLEVEIREILVQAAQPSAPPRADLRALADRIAAMTRRAEGSQTDSTVLLREDRDR